MGTEDLIKELGALSYLGIFGVSLISNIFIPVPEEAVVLILGYLAGGTNFDLMILFPVVLLGLLISDIAIYLFSRRGNKLVSMFYDKVFANQLESKKEWITKHLGKVIFISRFLVQFRFLGPFFAGQNKISFMRFVLIDLCALLIYVPVYLGLGLYFRSRIEQIIGGIGVARNIIITVLVIAVIFSLMRVFKKSFLKMKPKNVENVGEN